MTVTPAWAPAAIWLGKLVRPRLLGASGVTKIGVRLLTPVATSLVLRNGDDVPAVLKSVAAEGVRAGVGGRDVELVVAIEIAHGDSPGRDAGAVVGVGSEGVVAVTQQHAHGVRRLVDHDEIGLAVAVEVPHRLSDGIGTDGEGRRREEARHSPIFQSFDGRPES